MVDYQNGQQYVSMMCNRNYDSIIALRCEHEDVLLNDPNQCEFRHLSIALLRTERFTDAIEHFERLIAVITPKMRNDGDYCELGAAHWGTGSINKAIDCWQQALGCNYGDGAKNMTPALLLYYAAVRSKNEQLRQQSVSEIEAKLKTGWSRNWPAPLGRFLVGAEPEDEVVVHLLREHPQRQPDEYCRFDFYRGVRFIESGDEAAAKACFLSAVDRLEQKTWSTEFVLARNELRDGM